MADNSQPPPTANAEINEELDASVEADINMEGTQQQPDAEAEDYRSLWPTSSP